MNKEELKETVRNYMKNECNWQDCPLDSNKRINRVGRYEAASEFLDIIDQLDEPETFLFARASLDGFSTGDVSEEWKRVPGFYNEVSNLGRVKSITHKAGNGKIYKGKLLKPIVTDSGYVNVALIDETNGRITKRLHRIVAQRFVPNPENKPEINHIDGDKQNNAATNLEWVTRKENQNHALETGLQIPLVGSEKPTAKLTENDVVDIRKEYREGCIQMELAEKYGVARQTISSIVNFKAWKHVLDTEEVTE